MSRTLGILPELSQSERAVWTAASFCLPIVLLLAIAVATNGFSVGDKYIIFVIVIAAIPAFGLLLLSSPGFIGRLTTEAALDRYLCLNLLTVLLASPMLAVTHYGELRPAIFWYAIAAAYLIALALVVAGSLRSAAGSLDRHVNAVNRFLVAIVPVAFVAATVLPTQWMGGFNRTLALAGAVVAGGLYLIWLLKLDIASDKGKRPLFLLLTAAVPAFAALAMCNVQLDYDALHYTAYLAPAAAVHAGRIPLIDVFCQYGQSYLLYNAAFTVLPATFHAAALVTALANVAYTLCFVAIMRKAISNHVVFIALATGLVVAFWLSFYFSVNGTPSLGGMRYFPVALVGAILVWLGQERSFSAASIAALLLCWSWSLEAALFGTFVHGAFAIAVSACRGPDLKQTAISIAVLIGRIAGLLLVFAVFVAAAYLVLAGQLPRYDLYVGMVLAYVGPDPFMEYNFFQQGFFAWAPVLVAFSVVPCLIVRACVSRTAFDRLPEITVIWALAVVFCVYCLVSTQPLYMKTAILPLFTLLFFAVDAVIGTPHRMRQVTASQISIAPIFVFLVGLLCGSASFNFRPPAFASASTSALAEFRYHGRPVPVDFSARLRALCQPTGDLASGNACHDQPNMPPVHYREFVSLVEKWQAASVVILAFHPMDALVATALQKPHRLPVTFAYVDGFSPALFQYIVTRSQPVISHTLAEGETIILPRDLLSLNELQWQLLKLITEEWRFALADTTDNFNVYRLHKADTAGAHLVLPDRPLKGRNSL